MTITSKSWRTILMLCVLAMVAAGCRDSGTAAPDDDDSDTVAADDGTDEEPAADIATDFGVTAEACPDAVNEDNGCIYLGIISDFTGTFQTFGEPLTRAQQAYWNTVNEAGGIGGYDIDVQAYVRDNEYLPDRHREVYDEIKGDVLALAQTLGSPTTAAIIGEMEADTMIGMPAGWTSANDFEDEVFQVGNNYCIEAMNGVDWFVENQGDAITKVMAVHFPGDYGDDAAVGAREAAENAGLEFVDQQTIPGQDNQGEAIAAIIREAPDLLFLTVGPLETATIVGQIAAQDFQSPVITSGPGWTTGLLGTPAAPALLGLLYQAGPFGPYGSDTDGHARMREAIGEVETPSEGYTAGWTYQYPLEAALRAAADNGDLTRQGLKDAMTSLSEVDYEGILPPEAGNYAGEPNDNILRATSIAKIVEAGEEAPTGTEQLADAYTGPTAEGFQFEGPCFPNI